MIKYSSVLQNNIAYVLYFSVQYCQIKYTIQYITETEMKLSPLHHCVLRGINYRE